MNRDQIALVQESFAVVEPHLADLATRYYADLLGAHPDLRSLYPGGPEQRRAKFASELAALVAVLDSLNEMVSTAATLGAEHATNGVLPENYEHFGVSLRRALAEVMGDRYDADIDTAWRLAFNLVAETMVHGANHADDEVVGYSRGRS